MFCLPQSLSKIAPHAPLCYTDCSPCLHLSQTVQIVPLFLKQLPMPPLTHRLLFTDTPCSPRPNLSHNHVPLCYTYSSSCLHLCHRLLTMSWLLHMLHSISHTNCFHADYVKQTVLHDDIILIDYSHVPLLQRQLPMPSLPLKDCSPCSLLCRSLYAPYFS